LLGVFLAVLLLSALGLALTMAAIGDALASGNLGASREMLYAADAGIERVLPDLQRASDWDLVLSGAVTSGFTDGAAAGPRLLDDGRTIVLDELVNLANCGQRSPCNEAALTAITEDRPWGSDNPHWRLFAWGRIAALVGAGASGYVVVLVADDPLDGDGQPGRDARGPSPGSGVLLLRAQAYGRGGAGHLVEAAVARTGQRSMASGYTGQRGGTGHTTGEPAAGVPSGGDLSQMQILLDEWEAGR
jgi:hypothetical protein